MSNNSRAENIMMLTEAFCKLEQNKPFFLARGDSKKNYDLLNKLILMEAKRLEFLNGLTKVGTVDP